MEQIKQFEPGFTLGERAETIEKQEDGSFIVTSNEGVNFICARQRRWFRQF
jgi:thioredoxin reductase (NADPH)